MTADPAEIGARMVEAAGEAARRAMCVPGCCMEGTGCEMPPCHCSTVAARAALAAAAKEAGLDAEALFDAQAVLTARAEMRRRREAEGWGQTDPAKTSRIERTAALLRALAGIADA